MRAVNLIPADMRPGGGAGTAGRSGGAVYIIIAGLAVLVGMGGVYALYQQKIDDRQRQIAEAQREAAVAQARADALQPYVQVQQIRGQRAAVAAQLTGARFNWGLAIKQLSQALPRDASVCAVKGTINGTVSAAVPNGCGAGSSVRSSMSAAPALEVSGCAPSHVGVAHVIGALRRIPGTTIVSATESTRTASTSTGSADAAPSCTGAHYSLVIFFTGTPMPGSAVPSIGAPTASVGSATSAPASAVGSATRVTSGSGAAG